MKKFFLLLIGISLISCALYSQDTSKATITTYEAFNPQSIDPQTDVKKDLQLLKWNISLLSRGAFHLNYERALTKLFSVEAGAGIAYRDYQTELFHLDIYDFSNDFYDQDFTVAPGFSFDVNPRVYPEGTLDGFYFGPCFRYRKYNISVEDYQYYNEVISSTITIPGTSNVGYSNKEIGFLIGYQSDSWWSDIVMDYYFGVTLNTQKYNEINSISGGFDSKQKTVPAILLGLKIALMEF